jgi:hypothetical protein
MSTMRFFALSVARASEPGRSTKRRDTTLRGRRGKTTIFLKAKGFIKVSLSGKRWREANSWFGRNERY